MAKQCFFPSILIAVFIISGIHNPLVAQSFRWQQKISYQMEIDFDVKRHQYLGKQVIQYTNNSPETLDRVFYHLYLNAFQPNSMMDMKSRTVADPDLRVATRISELKPDEQGYIKVRSLKQDGKVLDFEEVGTILEVQLHQAIEPGQTTTLVMEWQAQVPIQIRRNGRDNSEGISYSMSQWYPKLCEYDEQGWHANPYVGREFYGVWGDFDVKISISKKYVVGGTGYLQNPDEIGYGYADESMDLGTSKGKKITYHFKAPNVHDFVWAADPDYTHTSYKAENGPMMHFFYQEGDETTDNWEALPIIMDKAFTFINAKYGEYPYEQYSFIQGGDGGMEYPMATLITGERSLNSLVGVSVHELMHSWYQMVLGTNESLYPWIDEGFTSYASSEVMNYLRANGYLPGTANPNPHRGSMLGYLSLAKRGLDEPLITHADHYIRNQAYWVGAYSKGATFLLQLQYICGQKNLDQALLDFYNTWKFRHPNVNDFIRVIEKQSGMELDWFKEYFVNTTHTIDYGIKGLRTQGGKGSVLTLNRRGYFPMPIDLLVEYKNGNEELIHIPLRVMRGAKMSEMPSIPYRVAEDWPWTHPEYELLIEAKPGEIERIIIDPSGRMADINLDDNVFPYEKEERPVREKN